MSVGTQQKRNQREDAYPPDANGGDMIRPQQSIGAIAASSRVQAEIQAALTVAAARPRDEVECLDRIKIACQRLKLAEKASYLYDRGGTDIYGASIKLLECIATYWGNIRSGFRELSRTKGESVVEAYAIDLERGTYKNLEFVVRHWRDTKKGGHPLTADRDIYELVANMAQRRVRKCLEGVIPSDIVDEALEECENTLKAKVDITTDRLKTMVEKFAEFEVSQKQIEARIQRHLDKITPAQFLAMMRVYNSLKDGMSEVDNWFDVEEVQVGAESEKKTATESLKEELKKKTADGKKEEAKETTETGKTETTEGQQAEKLTGKQLEEEFSASLAGAKTVQEITSMARAFDDIAVTDEDHAMIAGMSEEAAERLPKPTEPPKKNGGGLPGMETSDEPNGPKGGPKKK